MVDDRRRKRGRWLVYLYRGTVLTKEDKGKNKGRGGGERDKEENGEVRCWSGQKRGKYVRRKRGGLQLAGTATYYTIFSTS